MILTEKRVPSIYSDESRDFQLFGHLYDLVFANSAVNTRLMKNNPLTDYTNEQFLDLAALTIGFDVKHHYDSKDLLAICSIFKEAIKIKGTKKAIELVIQALLNSQNLIARYEIISIENNNINIYIPRKLRDVVLLEDLMDYILPAGMTYSIIQTDIVQASSASTQLVYQPDSVSVDKKTSSELSNSVEVKDSDNNTIAITSMFDTGIVVTGDEQSTIKQLATPQNVSVTNNITEFDSVENAENYDIYVDDSLYDNVKGE